MGMENKPSTCPPRGKADEVRNTAEAIEKTPEPEDPAVVGRTPAFGDQQLGIGLVSWRVK